MGSLHWRVAVRILNMQRPTSHAAETLKRHGYQGVVAAIAKFDDEMKQLLSVGAHTAFDLYSEAGAGFADHVCNVFQAKAPRARQRYPE